MKSYKVWLLFLLLSITIFSSDQYIYSQITEDNLVVSDQYIVNGFDLENLTSVDAIGIGKISLKDFLSSSLLYEEREFNNVENERYEYNDDSMSMIKFALNKNIGIPTIANFNLTQVDDSGDIPIYRRLIDERYTIPAPTTNFLEKDLENSKNTFIYNEENELEHLIAYKYQEVVYRLYIGIKNNNLIPLKKIQVGTNLDNFYSSNNYIDFIFENNGSIQTIEKDGIVGKFVDGKFELLGLEDGKIYNLDLYTLRYRGNTSTGNYVVVTYENTLSFTGKNNGSIQGDMAWLEDIDIFNYQNIDLNVITVTNDNLSQIKLVGISEERELFVNTVSDISITAPVSPSINLGGINYNVIDNRIIVDSIEYEVVDNKVTIDGTEYEVKNSINLGGTNYKVIDNQIVVGSTKYNVVNNRVSIDGIEYIVVNNEVTIDGILYQMIDNKIIIDEKKYVYRWTGRYDTKFNEEEGKERIISFDIEGTGFTGDNQVGKYIEPIPVEKDIRYPHQRVVFESNYELKDQKYQMIDRVLIPARLGYRQIKTIAYDSNLLEYLLGGSYINVNEFKFINNRWGYLVDENVEGIMVEKTISEAKAELKDEDGEKVEFYTDDIGSGIRKVNENGDKVVYNWSEGASNSNGVILNYDKVMFRLVKVPEDKVISENQNYKVDSLDYSVELPIYYWNPYKNSNPINYLDEEKVVDTGGGDQVSEGSLKMDKFLFGDENGNYDNYVDLVFDANSDKEMTFSNAVISYESTNNNLRIIGLPVGEYLLEFYSIKRGHDGTYKIITYVNHDTFIMDIPEIASEEFAKENNVYKIDFITTSTSNNAIQVNVNFITKMEREITLTADNLQSINLPEFKLSEKNEGTGEVEGVGILDQIKLEESNQRRFLFPLDIVFVIDNSGSMQNEIDAVKNGLSAFGQELYERGFDVKYNLITFGPAQTSSRIGDWRWKIYDRYDSNYMAIYKEKWFDGVSLGNVTLENKREKETEELIDAFNSISAGSGYRYGQENSAWGLHYAIEKLRSNGRYLSYSGEITNNSDDGYMPSQKMIFFLTDENMDTQNLPNGYTRGGVLGELYAKLNSTYNGLADNINLTGLFHVKKQGNNADLTATTELKFYEEVPGLKYKYTNGMRSEWSDRKWMWRTTWNRNNYSTNPNYQFIRYTRSGVYYRIRLVNSTIWEEWDDNKTPIYGINPSDRGDKSHTDFKLYNTGNNFFMYEMGSSGEYVEDALQTAISNIGIIQRWELSYLTPFNEYDGTTRTVDFKLIDVKGIDGTIINREIRDLDKYEDKQYMVQEEKLVVEFQDPTGSSPKLSIVDGKGVITFLARSRYHELDNEGNTIIIEDVIKERSLDVLKTDGTLLFNRTTDDITMSLSSDGWSPFKIAVGNLENILSDRASSWMDVKNLPIGSNSVKEILSYIDKAKYRVDGSNNYEMWLKKSEVDGLIDHDLGDNPNVPYFNLVINGSKARVSETYFKELMGDRSDAWYELKNSSTDPNLFDRIISSDFEKLDGTRHRIRLSDLELKDLLENTSGNDVELKISKAKLEDIDGDSTNFKDFGQQGWYEFSITLSDVEMDILRNTQLIGKPIEYIDLEATATTDLFTETKVLLNVEVDVIPPKIVEVSITDQTLKAFLRSIRVLDESILFSNIESKNYSGYTVTNRADLENLLTNGGSYVKTGDILDIDIVIEDKNLTEDDIYIGLNELGWRIPTISIEADGPNGEKRFRISWTGVEVGGVSGSIGIGNTIEDRYGNIGNQNFGILNIDMTDIVPTKTLIDKNDVEILTHPSDNKYYVNANYDIDLEDRGNLYRAGILAFEYDNNKSDNKDGVPSYHSSPNGLYTGGIKEKVFEVAVDNVTHKMDGEYIGVVYGMSRSGKLIGISNYSDDDFDKIMDANYTSSTLEKTTIMVDTVTPVISDVNIINKTFKDKYRVNSVGGGDTVYVKDGDKVEVSFNVKDFNMYNQEINENSTEKGGYLLELLNGYSVDNLSGSIIKSSEEDYTVTYTFVINDSDLIERDIDLSLIAEDKAGNQMVEEKIIVLNNNLPKNIILEIYEDVEDWYNATTKRIGKGGDPTVGKFTKGGGASLINNPMIYGRISGFGAEVRYLNIQKNGDVSEPLLEILNQTSEIKIDETNGIKFKVDTTNTVKVVPISLSGVVGSEIEFKFIVDTRVNTSYLQGGIVGSLLGGHIVIDLSNLKELVGVDGYSYTFVVGGEVVKSGGEINLNGSSFTTKQEGSISEIIDINTSEFQGGSRADLIITVWDRLGHEKTFEKTYFIPTTTLGIKTIIEGESRQRESKLKIIGEGDSDKFKLDSSIDSSKE